MSGQATLYERIGGRPAVKAAVGLFYEKVIADERINGFFDTLDMDRQRAMQEAFLTYAFGGPAAYSGRDLRTAHARLQLQDEHFMAVGEHLQATLEELGVPADVVGEVMALVVTTRDDVLGR